MVNVSAVSCISILSVPVSSPVSLVPRGLLRLVPVVTRLPIPVMGSLMAWHFLVILHLILFAVSDSSLSRQHLTVKIVVICPVLRRPLVLVLAIWLSSERLPLVVIVTVPFPGIVVRVAISVRIIGRWATVILIQVVERLVILV